MRHCAGLNMKYRCDNGTCGECAARLLEGEIEALHPTDFCFSEWRRANGFFLPCSHGAGSDIAIEAAEYQQAGQLPAQQIVAKVKKKDIPQTDLLILQLKTPRTQPCNS